MIRREIQFLDIAAVLRIHADTIANDGGSPGVRDHGLLDAAIAMPRQRFGGEFLHPDLPSMAAAYLFHLACNHAFIDGNKRVAVMAAWVFLDLNGIELRATPDELEAVTLRVASGESKKDDLTAWFREHLPG